MEWKKAKKQLLNNRELKKAYLSHDLAYSISKMIIDARIERNLTQKELAEKVGTLQPAIARIESGSSLPSLSFLQRIAHALNTELLAPRLKMLEDKAALRSLSYELDWLTTGYRQAPVQSNFEYANSESIFSVKEFSHA